MKGKTEHNQQMSYLVSGLYIMLMNCSVPCSQCQIRNKSAVCMYVHNSEVFTSVGFANSD